MTYDNPYSNSKTHYCTSTSNVYFRNKNFREQKILRVSRILVFAKVYESKFFWLIMQVYFFMTVQIPFWLVRKRLCAWNFFKSSRFLNFVETLSLVELVPFNRNHFITQSFGFARKHKFTWSVKRSVSLKVCVHV